MKNSLAMGDKMSETEKSYSNAFTRSFEELLRIIRDYGLPTAAFGAGIYGFLLILNVNVATELKAVLAAVLSIVGLGTQMWIFSRENPRIHSNEYTRLVEKMIEQNNFYTKCSTETQKELLKLIAIRKVAPRGPDKIDVG
jgi:hypothetical protein